MCFLTLLSLLSHHLHIIIWVKCGRCSRCFRFAAISFFHAKLTDALLGTVRGLPTKRLALAPLQLWPEFVLFVFELLPFHTHVNAIFVCGFVFQFASEFVSQNLGTQLVASTALAAF